MSTDTDRMHILQLLDDGAICAPEALRRLDALVPLAPAAVVDAPAALVPEHAPSNRDLERWRRWWMWPLYAGLGVTLLGALLMYAAYAAFGFGLGLLLAALPFGLGVLVMALAAGTRSAKWVHLRLQRGGAGGPRRLALSFPLPLRFSAWLLRALGSRLPQLRHSGVDDLLIALAESTSLDAPLYLDVRSGAGGEQVQVYIG